jgi:hypothetical protein
MKIETFVHRGSARVVFDNGEEKWTMRHEDINCINEDIWDRQREGVKVLAPDTRIEVVFEEDRKIDIEWDSDMAKVIWESLVDIGFHRVENGKRLTEVFKELDDDSTTMAISGSIPQEQLDGMLEKADMVKDWRKVYIMNEEEINSYE